MIDDDPADASTQADPDHRLVDTSTLGEFDPLATRAPDLDDPLMTVAEGAAATRFDSSLAVANGPRAPLPPGLPRYRVIRPHARGAIGEVYLAHDEELRREVALKEIQERYADDPRSRARFLLEAEVTGSLEHPGIIPVYGLGHHPDGRPYYAMRFIRGDSLKEAIDRHHRLWDRPGGDPSERSLAFRKLLRKFIDVCNAIAYAHSRGVLHRDLKPSNVMLGPYGETLVVDWGLAKPQSGACDDAPGDLPPIPLSGESSATVAGSVIGTPAFMSPEQAAGELDRVGPAGDIYSLGATLYYLLVGTTPYDGLKVLEILDRVRRGDFSPPRAIRREVPRGLEAIALKAMATRPEDRYRSARALADEVEHWLAGAPVSAYPDRLLARVGRWCRRHPALASVAASCLFLDVCCAVVSGLVFVESVLQAGLLPRLNVAAAVLVLIPLAGQAGALAGLAAGALVGGAWRRTNEAVHRGAGVGLKFGVPTAILLYLALGAFEVVKPPSWAAIRPTAPGPVPPLAWPRLPGAVLVAPSWAWGEGTPDLAGFFAEPPRERNAAPAYLDALMEFDPAMARCFSPDEGARRAAIAGPRGERLVRIAVAWRADPASVDRGERDALLDDLEVGFAKILVAQRRDSCVFRVGFGPGDPPHARAGLLAGWALGLRAARRLERDEVAPALDDLRVLLRLADDLRSRGDWATQRAAQAVESVASDVVALPILRRPGLRLDQAERLAKLLDERPETGRDPIPEAALAEYLKAGESLRPFLDRLERDGGLSSGALAALRSLVGLPPDGSDPASDGLEDDYADLRAKLADQIGRQTPAEFVRATERALASYHRGLVELAVQPRPVGIELASGLPAFRLGGHPILLRVLPDGSTSRAWVEGIAHSEADLRALRCLVALRLWDLQGRGTPVDLNAVARASGLPGAPVDPFRPDGGPLGLELEGGEPVVTSVGPEGDGEKPNGLRYRVGPGKPRD